MAAKREPRQIILTHWNAGVFRSSALPQILPELAVYSLLYDEVLIREEDLLTNRAITRLLMQPNSYSFFEELLVNGVVKLLRLPAAEYPTGRRFDPLRLPISARAEEHQLRRSYKGGPWRPTSAEWQLFERLDHIVARHPTASRFHAPFPSGNPFATELAELLENRERYSLGTHPVFRYIHPRTADEFVRFCREPETWQRFLSDSGVKSMIVGPGGGFFRTAAYQCFHQLPTPRSMQRLVESVYAATYCAREDSDGRYGGSNLVELPYKYAQQDERDAAAATITRVEVIPTDATASLSVGSGIGTVLVRTREAPEFQRLQEVLDRLGSAPGGLQLPSESEFRDAWRAVCSVYADHWAAVMVKTAAVDKWVTHFGVFAYVLARVVGFLVLPHGRSHYDGHVLEDALAIRSIEHMGPALTKSFRALLKTPGVYNSLVDSTGIRCSRVALNRSNR